MKLSLAHSFLLFCISACVATLLEALLLNHTRELRQPPSLPSQLYFDTLKLKFESVHDVLKVHIITPIRCTTTKKFIVVVVHIVYAWLHTHIPEQVTGCMVHSIESCLTYTKQNQMSSSLNLHLTAKMINICKIFLANPLMCLNKHLQGESCFRSYK